jgi:hypothetical protein
VFVNVRRKHVSLGIFLPVFVTGAASLALWLNFRMTRFVPADMRRAMMHLGGSMVACQLLSPVVSAQLVGTGNSLLRMVALLGVTLPALVYAILSVIWMISQVQGTLRNGMMR